MLPMKTFSKDDWWGWGGAERFSDGSEPKIGFIDMIDTPEGSSSSSWMTVIWDNQGLGLYEEGAFYNFEGIRVSIPVLLEMLAPKMTNDQLLDVLKYSDHDEPEFDDDIDCDSVVDDGCFCCD